MSAVSTRRPRPLRVFFYRGGWRWSCYADRPASSIVPCMVGSNGPAGYEFAADAYRSAWTHLWIMHIKEDHP
jgi:hypothetical protein